MQNGSEVQGSFLCIIWNLDSYWWILMGTVYKFSILELRWTISPDEAAEYACNLLVVDLNTNIKYTHRFWCPEQSESPRKEFLKVPTTQNAPKVNPGKKRGCGDGCEASSSTAVQSPRSPPLHCRVQITWWSAGCNRTLWWEWQLAQTSGRSEDTWTWELRETTQAGKVSRKNWK